MRGPWSKGDPVTLLRPYIQPGDTVVDVGANAGTVAQEYALLVGERGRVICFEPDSRAWEGLGRVVQRHWPIIEAYALAVSDCVGAATLQLATDGKCNSLSADNPGLTNPMPCPTWAVDLDHWLTNRRVDAVKIDVQGAELDVLRGCPRLLQRCPAWCLEVWPRGLQAAGASATALYQLLTTNGLTVRDARGDAISRADGEQFDAKIGSGFINILATR